MKQIIPRGGEGVDATFRAFTGAVSLKPFTLLTSEEIRAAFRAFTGAVSLKLGSR